MMRHAPLAVFAVVSAGASGGAVGFRALVIEPVAVRGGVLMLPLTAERHGNDWPATMRLTFADGRRVEGLVAWLTPEPAVPRSWTAEPAAARVRAIEPDDDTAASAPAPGTGAAYLLARLPANGLGEIRFGGGQRLRPIWIEAPPAAPRRGAAGVALDAIASDDRPDPHSPFTQWRWALLADRLGLDPPPPERFGDGVGCLVAEHDAALWRAGLARLESQSPGVASACRDLLTATCRDGDRAIAAWVADPRRTGALLSLLLARDGEGPELVDAALRWADEQETFLVWPEPGDDRRVTVAFANPSLEPGVATLAWDRGGEIPIAVELPAGRVTRVALERPPADDGAGGGAGASPAATPPITQVLIVEIAGRSRQLAFYRPLLTAAPPGVFFPPLQPPITLLQTQTGRPAPIVPERATLAHLRRREGRWEIFLECRRPVPTDGQRRPGDDRAEAITLLLGLEGAPGRAVALTVPEQGSWELSRGVDDGTLEVHRRSGADRWLCRVVLPDAWIPGVGPLLVGMRRSHGDNDAFETGPYQSLPWRDEPGRAAIELGRWKE